MDRAACAGADCFQAVNGDRMYLFHGSILSAVVILGNLLLLGLTNDMLGKGQNGGAIHLPCIIVICETHLSYGVLRHCKYLVCL